MHHELSGAFAPLAAERARQHAWRVRRALVLLLCAAPALAMLGERAGFGHLLGRLFGYALAVWSAVWAGSRAWPWWRQRAWRCRPHIGSAEAKALVGWTRAHGGLRPPPQTARWDDAAYAFSLLAGPQAHCAWTHAHVREVLASLSAPAAWAPSAASRRRTAAGAWALLAAALVLAWPSAGARVWQRVRGEPIWHAANEPLTADWQMRIEPPAYTGWPIDAPPLSNGDVTALAGSRLHVRARVDGPWQRAQIAFFAHADAPLGERPVGYAPATLEPEALGVKAVIPLGATVAWAFVLTDAHNERWREEPLHRLHVQADQAPQALLRAPQDDDDWPRRGPVSVVFCLRDDVGLSRAELCVQPLTDEGEVDGSPRCAPLPLPAKTTEKTREPVWQRTVVSAEELLPDPLPTSVQRLRVWAQALDNDAFSGPKRGQSAAVTVWLDDPQATRQRALRLVRQAHEAMIDWLGRAWPPPMPPVAAPVDETNAPMGPPTEADAIKVAHAQLRVAHQALGDDEQALPIERTTLAAALALADAVQKQKGVRPQTLGAQRETLAAHILAFDDLFASRHVAAAQAQAQHIEHGLDAMQRLLQSSATTMPQVAQAWARVKEAMRDYLAAASMQTPSLSERPAVGQSEQHGAFDDAIERIERALQQGDAQTAAQEMKQLQQRLQAEQEQAQQRERDERDPLDEKTRQALAQLANETRDATQEQHAIASDVRRLQSDQQRANSTQSPPAASLSPNAQPALAKRQRDNAERIGRLASELAALHEQQPLLPKEHPALARAQQQAQRACQTLGDGPVAQGLPPSQEAAAALAEFLQDLAAQREQSAAAGGRPAPMPGATPSPAPSEGSPKPSNGSNGRSRSRRSRATNGPSDGPTPPTDAEAGDGTSASGSPGEVAIPGLDARRDPARFREEVLKASKQAPPRHYEAPVRRYYEELLR